MSKKKENTIQTNKKFAEENLAFLAACQKVEIPVTKRQASKFRRGKGLAYKFLTRGKG